MLRSNFNNPGGAANITIKSIYNMHYSEIKEVYLYTQSRNQVQKNQLLLQTQCVYFNKITHFNADTFIATEYFYTVVLLLLLK